MVSELTSTRDSAPARGARGVSDGSMRCPTLTQLPASPPSKMGWPWTEETPQLP
jgi:hypothetical protein